MAAAIGAGLPVAEPTGNMIVDIGGGTTEVAVISLGGIVVSQSLRVGGDEMDEAIVNHVKREYKLLIGQQTAEEIKLEVGSASRMKEEVQAEVRGRDLLTGLPKTSSSPSEEVRHALEEPVEPDRRRDQVDARQDPARARRRHHGPRDRARRRRRAAERPRRAAPPRDAHAGAPRRVAAHLRRRRLRPEPRGVRGHPPEPRNVAAASYSSNHRPLARALTVAGATGRIVAYTKPLVPRNRQRASAALGSRRSARSRRLPSRPAARRAPRGRRRPRRALARRCVTVYFRESDDGALHRVQDVGATALRPFEVGAERVARPFRDSRRLVRRPARREVREREAARGERDASPAGDPRTRWPRRRTRSGRLLDYLDRAEFPTDYRPVKTRVITQAPRQFERADRDRRRLGHGHPRSTTPVVTADTLVGEVTKVTPERARDAPHRRDERRHRVRRSVRTRRGSSSRARAARSFSTT